MSSNSNFSFLLYPKYSASIDLKHLKNAYSKPSEKWYSRRTAYLRYNEKFDSSFQRNVYELIIDM